MAASELCRRPLVLERVESVPADATVRHVDQLEPETLVAFYDAVTGDHCVSSPTTDLESGEVIVFTDYYRVERA